VYALFFLGGCAAIALLEYAFFQLPLILGKLHLAQIPALEVTNRDSILNWLTSVFLLGTAVMAWANFRLGVRFKDPLGKIHAWFWSSLAALFLSLDVHTALHETIRELLIAVSGTTLYQDGTVWWIAVYGFILGLIGIRILLDLFSYALSLGLFVLAVSGGIVGQLLNFGFIPVPWNGTELVMLETGLAATSALFLFLSVGLFARRQVFRDPETALRWFAQSWNHAPLLAMIEAKTTPPQPTVLVAKPAEKKEQEPKAVKLPAVKQPPKPQPNTEAVSFKKVTLPDTEFDLTG
jgi:hypothetical protein